MICTPENSRLLAGYLDLYGIETTDAQRTVMLKHLDLVVEKNKLLNLTRITESTDAIIRHLVDSLLLYPTLSQCRHVQSFVDIGTGAGFPGIPLGIVTQAHGILIDSVGKKANAVDEFISALGLSERLAVQSTRAEDLARSMPESFDVVTARAVAGLGVLVEYASPLLRSRGSLIVSKANVSDEELDSGIVTARLTGMKYVSRETYELPNDQGHRTILRFDKVGKSSVKLPRANGMAKHKPLA